MPMTLDLAEASTVVQAAPKEPIRVLFVSHDAGLDGAQRTLLTLLSAIDRRVCGLHMPVHALAKANHIWNYNLIYAYQKLIIP